MWETVASSVINRPTNATTKLTAIAKIPKYKRFQERQLFISVAMEVHGAPIYDMDPFIRECAYLFHDRQLRGHLSLSFSIQFFKQCASIVFQHVLAFAIKRKIALVNDVYSRPPTIIKSHNLHVGDIKGAMGDIVSYHERN
jgi:hypothetical protein